MAGDRGYRIFNVVLARKQVLSPSMLSCVFRGEEVRQMKMDAPDQRIKLLFPALNGAPSALADEGNWWEKVCAMPAEQRPLLRTYTLRQVDTDAAELTVEFVMHGTDGPASAWALSAQPGDTLQIVAPNRDHIADSGGYEWKPHPDVPYAMVIADETALPAAKGILEQLAGWRNPPQMQLFIEMPHADDFVDFSHYPFAEVHWLARESRAHGEALLEAVRERVMLPDNVLVGETLSEEDDDTILWDGSASACTRFHGWVAAESSTVKHLRRYLIGERGLSQDCISFMAYWSRGGRRKAA